MPSDLSTLNTPPVSSMMINIRSIPVPKFYFSKVGKVFYPPTKGYFNKMDPSPQNTTEVYNFIGNPISKSEIGIPSKDSESDRIQTFGSYDTKCSFNFWDPVDSQFFKMENTDDTTVPRYGKESSFIAGLLEMDYSTGMPVIRENRYIYRRWFMCSLGFIRFFKYIELVTESAESISADFSGSFFDTEMLAKRISYNRCHQINSKPEARCVEQVSVSHPHNLTILAWLVTNDSIPTSLPVISGTSPFIKYWDYDKQMIESWMTSFTMTKKYVIQPEKKTTIDNEIKEVVLKHIEKRVDELLLQLLPPYVEKYLDTKLSFLLNDSGEPSSK